MPIFMDLHIVPGVTARQVAEAHLLDVKVQDAYCCKAMTYWLDEDKGCVFCLIEAPDKESVLEMHSKAHGLIPHEIIAVNTDVVKAFLGRIQDPEKVIQLPESNIKVFSESAFRILLLTKTTDSRLLQHELGPARAHELLLLYDTVVREQCRTSGGSEVYRREDGFVVSFTSHRQALDCALAIQKKLGKTADLIRLRIVMHGGEPVTKDENIFGAIIRQAQFMCNFSSHQRVMLSSIVRDLFKDNDWNLMIATDQAVCFSSAEDAFFQNLSDTLEANWQDTTFDILDFCETMSVSKSQLYRKCVSLTAMSPNAILREYRLLRSLDVLRKEDRNIAQTTFDTGFGSPSYFTKCFQRRFGLQPLAYVKARF
jgi:AraC-like DNA-binding protein